MFAPEQLAGIRAMITAGGTPLGGDMMDMMPKLGAIVCYGTGYDGVDLAAAAKRKIAVGHSPGANASSVADIAVTLMLAVTRRLLVGGRLCAKRQLGRGKTVADDASAAGHARPPGRRLRHGRDRPQDRGTGGGIRERGRLFQPQPARVPYRYFPSLEALAEWCSVLMIAVRAGPDTHHAVDAEILQKLGADGYVVNIARGSVIDQQALVAALADKTIAGAGLDVYATEPHRAGCADRVSECGADPAYRRPYASNSHIAMQDCVIANLEAFFAGRPLPYGVRGA